MNILIASSIDSQAVAQLERDHDVVCAFGAPETELRALMHDREVLIFRSGVTISAEVMRCAPGLKLLIRGGSGFDNIDLDHLHSRGLELIRVPEPGARAVAELTFALMLALARNVLEADRLWRKGRWVKHQFTSYLLHGKVLGIVGAGSIGSQVGRLGAAWGMEVIGCVARPSPTIAEKLCKADLRLVDFDEVVASSDFMSVHVPLTEATRNLIDADVFGRMKPGSFLVNMARGGVVDEAALHSELVSGTRLRGAALDVHAAEGEGRISPLADLPNVVLTPHIGATTVDTQREIGERILAIVHSFAAREETAATAAVAS